MPTIIEDRIADCPECGGSYTVSLRDDGFKSYFQCFRCHWEQNADLDGHADLDTVYLQISTYVPIHTRPVHGE